MSRHALLLSVLLMASSCTIVQVHGANPSTSVHFGILKMEPVEGSRSLSYRLRGVGLVPTINGATLGYAQEDVVLAYHPEDCRVVIFEVPADSRDMLDQLVDPAICQPRRAE